MGQIQAPPDVIGAAQLWVVPSRFSNITVPFATAPIPALWESLRSEQERAMTTYVELVDVVTAGGRVAGSLPGDILVIKQGVTIVTGTGAYEFTGGHLSATVAGTVVSNPETTSSIKACIQTGHTTLPASGGSTINITASGTLSGRLGVQMLNGNNTLNNNGMISGASTSSPAGVGADMSGANNTVTNMGTISGGLHGITLAGGSCTIANDGTITGVAGNGIIAYAGTSQTIRNTSTISGGANGIQLSNSGCAVTNEGTIAGSIGSGIVLFGNLQTVSNTGTITGGAHGIANLALAGAAGLFVENSGTIASTGDISGDGIFAAGRLRLTNSGTIDSAGYYGVKCGYASIVNSGNIACLYGISAIGLNSSLASTITNLDTGIISGPNQSSIRNLGTGALTIVNNGQIKGAISLGSNNDSYDGTLGTAIGAINGDGGDDAIAGGDGRELINGGSGNDDLDGGGGNDAFVVSGNDGDDIYDGGAGIDRISFAAVTTGGVAVDIAGQSAGGISPGNIGNDTILNIEQVIGTAFTDSLFGDGSTNQLYGGASADTLAGFDGSDRLFGDAGADNIIGGQGRDYLTGGADADTFRYQAVLFPTRMSSQIPCSLPTR
jgi:Ca2+-binding RTX toxin-like protein